MPENFSDWLGVAGFVLACLLGLWQVWARWEERHDKIRATFTWSMTIHNPSGTIEVQIANVGRTQIHLKSVALVYEMEGEKSQESGATIQEVGGEVSFVLSDGQPAPLVPGDRCTYVLPEAMTGVYQHVSALPADNLRIDILSGRGLLSQIRDPQIHQNLCWIAQRIKIPAASGGVFQKSVSWRSSCSLQYSAPCFLT